MKKYLVLAKCGCWWIESAPDSFTPDPTAPRVCSRCQWNPDRWPDDAGFSRSPQGMTMAPVTYLPATCLGDS